VAQWLANFYVEPFQLHVLPMPVLLLPVLRAVEFALTIASVVLLDGGYVALALLQSPLATILPDTNAVVSLALLEAQLQCSVMLLLWQLEPTHVIKSLDLVVCLSQHLLPSLNQTLALAIATTRVPMSVLNRSSVLVLTLLLALDLASILLLIPATVNSYSTKAKYQPVECLLCSSKTGNCVLPLLLFVVEPSAATILLPMSATPTIWLVLITIFSVLSLHLSIADPIRVTIVPSIVV